VDKGSKYKKEAEIFKSKRKMRIIKYISFIILLFVALFSSCKIGQKYRSPELKGMPATFDASDLPAGSTADMGWSTLYKDPVLQALIDRALVNNKDMLMATSRIKQMIAEKRIKFADMLPEIGLNASGKREYTNYGGHNDDYSNEFVGNLGIAWELDLWGNLRWKNDAGVAVYMQSVEAQKALQLTIISQVAQTYFELSALNHELRIVKQTLDSRKEGVRFAHLRYEGGLTSEIPYRQSVVELARTETLVPDLENQIKLKESDLAVLLGEYPSSVVFPYEGLQNLNVLDSLLVNLPSELLRNRPDVRIAEQKLIEYNAQVGVALTDMFPKLSLTGSLGGESDDLSNFLESPAWLISGALTAPIFNFGKNKAGYDAAKAAYEEQIYSYEQVVLNVFKEVNNALSSFYKTKEMRMSQEKLYESVQSYHNLARLQYVNGIVNYLDVLDAQRQFFDAEIALNNTQLQELTAIVNLYKALGGGIKR